MLSETSAEYLNQAKYFVGSGKYDDALEYVNKALDCDKMEPELYIEKGIILANKEDFNGASDEFKNVLKIDKNNAEAYFHLGNLSIMQNDKSQGLSYYNKAIANGFDDAVVYYNLGLMYEENKEPELAVRNYTKAILKDPLRVDARIRKSKIYIDAKKYPEALETLDELILTDPDLFDGYHLKALLLAETGRTDEAIKVCEDAEKLFPKDPAFGLDKVNIYVIQKNIEKAKQEVAALESKYELNNRQKRQLALEKARLYAIDQNVDKIVENLLDAKKFTKADDENNIDTEATFLLANCYLEKKDYDNAIVMCQEEIKANDPQYVIPCYYVLPLAYRNKGEEEKAVAQYKESIDKLRAITLSNPSLHDGYLFRAICLRDIKEYDKALEICDYLLKIDENNETFKKLKADILSHKDSNGKSEKPATASVNG